MDSIYLDYASTTPTDPAVVEAMIPYFYERFGNASSPHAFGRDAKKALDESRETVARVIHARPEEIVFTSGGTEANNQAILGTAQALKTRGNHIILSSIEHHSVLKPVEMLAKEGFQITRLPVTGQGKVAVDVLEKAVTPQTILVCIMHANNEIGTIQDVPAIASLCRSKGIYFLLDAVQTVGHIPVDVTALGCDFLSMSAHKFYGPKGVGALYVRKGVNIPALLLGGDQERTRRASTQNVAGIVGMAKALQICAERMDDEVKIQTHLRDKIVRTVLNDIPGSVLNGHPVDRLPNNTHFSFCGLDAESLLMSLDMSGIATSMGSACRSGHMEPSHVVRALGHPDDLAYGSLRVTLGRWTTEQHIDRFLELLRQKIQQLKV